MMRGSPLQHGADAAASSGNQLTREAVFDLMNSPRRRYVIYYLHQLGEPIELQALATEVAAWENDIPPDDLDDQQRKRVYVSLYQTHIPKLAESGIIAYDKDSGMVAITSRAAEVGQYIAIDGHDRPWERYYLGLAILSTAFFLLAVLNVWAFASISAPAVGLFVSLAYVVLAGAHYLSVSRNRMRALETLVES